jgi:hypothetical protein
MLRLSNGTSTKLQRPSKTITGNPTHSIFNLMEVQPTLDAPPLIQDGGKSGELRVVSSSTRKERFLKFKTKTLIPMLKTETSKLPTEETVMISDSNGRSFM